MSFMSSVRVLGVAFGSMFGSKIILDHGTKDLRILFYRYIAFTFLAVGVKFVPNLYTNLLGGLVHGYCVGVLGICY